MTTVEWENVAVGVQRDSVQNWTQLVGLSQVLCLVWPEPSVILSVAVYTS